jgi:hypothetical protein
MTAENPLRAEHFRRYDEAPDDQFYREARLVTHIDDAAVAAATAFYRDLLPARGRILDLMSSWVSHLPADAEYAAVAGLGMNAAELEANSRLTERVVQDLNVDPALPWGDGSFDAAIVTVSVQYLTRPAECSRRWDGCLWKGRPSRCFTRTGASPQRRWRSGNRSAAASTRTSSGCTSAFRARSTLPRRTT